MLKTRQCLLGIRTFLGVTSRIWSFILYILRKHLRTIIQYQTVRYDTLPLSPVSRNRLNAVKRKILVLDLDETLIHSHHDGVLRPTVRPGTPPDFILKVVIDKHPVRFFVHKRPHVDFFLEVVSQWYELVVFTASMEIYGSAVADKLDNNRAILKRRYYRQHCTLDLGSYIKDLSVVHSDLSSIVILDNSPGAYRSHPDNAIPIKSWFSDPSDTALLNLLPMLDALRFVSVFFLQNRRQSVWDFFCTRQLCHPQIFLFLTNIKLLFRLSHFGLVSQMGLRLGLGLSLIYDI
ncbi:CTD nuclear envelope phosphatase 1A isoform X1 [Pimephales promelas]|uniref:CTD nuclear envelope phosphatase 1A isoform X1 n=1 Tax=Pimephales promelas TaxID=90988 RepID=UPI001955B4AB|nr:CTD nuclear envelope phosphatase 1A isoform X1 [Pimephales promelas]